MLTVHILDERPERDPNEYDLTVPSPTTLRELLVYVNADPEQTFEVANDSHALTLDEALTDGDTLTISRVAV